ncbi:hypothetical protein SDC9_160608 [bioreactor metagenome]|uniref:Uncharacterized protein n=1 Tax=bioreactor metagenome TaxID=1076179 RepID=A0A645FG30_9ZZZZ
MEAEGGMVEQYERAGGHAVDIRPGPIQKGEGFVQARRIGAGRAENHHQQIGNAFGRSVFDHLERFIDPGAFVHPIEHPLRTALHAPADPAAAGAGGFVQQRRRIFSDRPGHHLKPAVEAQRQNGVAEDVEVDRIDILVDDIEMATAEADPPLQHLLRHRRRRAAAVTAEGTVVGAEAAAAPFASAAAVDGHDRDRVEVPVGGKPGKIGRRQ